MVSRRDFAFGTYTLYRQPWGFYCGGAALCSDGKVRKLKRIAITADTFFSVPAAVKVKGKTVSGYVTVSTLSGSSVPVDGDPAVLMFRALLTGKNHGLLPEGQAKEVKG